MSLIEGLVFGNSYDGAPPTSTEPANTIDGTTGDGCGCWSLLYERHDSCHRAELHHRREHRHRYFLPPGFRALSKTLTSSGSHQEGDDVNKSYRRLYEKFEHSQR